MMIVHAPNKQKGCPEDCKGCNTENPHDKECKYLGKECGGCDNKGCER